MIVFYAFIKTGDVSLENFSPEVKEKLNIDYVTLSKINPQLIYWSLNWYWENINKKAYDVIIQAESWLASVNGVKNPMKNATAIIDSFSWLSLVLAISSLLYKREFTGKWDFVNIPMIASWIQMLEQNLIETSIESINPKLTWNHDNAIFPFWFFQVKYWEIALAIGNDTLWEKFTHNIIPELFWKYTSNQERLDNKEDLIKLMQEVFKKYTKEELSQILDTIGIPNGKINTLLDIVNDDTLYENKFIKKIHHKQLWEIVVPYEFIKYKSYPIEDITPSPDLWQNNKDFTFF